MSKKSFYFSRGRVSQQPTLGTSLTGFTLIEMVVVILVMGIAAVSLVFTMQQVLFNLARPEVISVSSALAVREAENIASAGFSSVSDQYRGAPQSYGGNFAAYDREIRVDSIDTAEPSLGSDAAMANYKVVEIRVHHPAINYVSIKLLKTNY